VSLRKEVSWLRENYRVSRQRISGLTEIAISNYRYRSTRSDEALRARLVELARKKRDSDIGGCTFCWMRAGRV